MSTGRKWFGMKSKRRQGKTNASRRSFRSARIETLEPRQVLSVPTLAPIADVTLYSGSPLHIPLDGFASDGLDISFGVTSSNPSVEVSIPSDSTLGDSIPGTNRSMKIETNYGDMVLELFEERVPRATERIITLAEDGFYDGIIFHRVIDDFMIQGGDPTGTGGGGSDLPDFDDQFHVDLQHNTSGLLSMAKSTDDTNNSQFFITEVPTRYLDYNHSIFGLLIEGEDVREAISEVNTKLNDDNNDNNKDADAAKPFTDVVMESVEIYYDNQNATLMLKAPEGMTGETDITITVYHDGQVYVQPSFHVTVKPDVTPNLPPFTLEDFNSNPFLADVAPIITTQNNATAIQLQSLDVDGDMIILDGEGGSFALSARFMDEDLYNYYAPRSLPFISHADLDYEVDPITGDLTVTPINDLVGVHPIFLTVSPWYSEGTNDTPMIALDTQLIPVVIQPDSLDPITELDMAIVQTPTTTDAYGEIDQLPDNVDWMDEWESFSVEIWASTKTATGSTNEFGIHTAAFDLTYNTDYYTATDIEYGNVFSQERTGTIDDASGRVNNIGGRTPMFALNSHHDVDVGVPEDSNDDYYYQLDPDSVEKFGDDKPVLVARVHFQPNATGRRRTHQWARRIHDAGHGFGSLYPKRPGGLERRRNHYCPGRRCARSRCLAHDVRLQ